MSEKIALPLNGGCQCGAVRYSITSAPVAYYWCHCTQCQRASGSAFGESLRVRRADVQVRGTLGHWARITDAGTTTEVTFCPVCATRIWHTRPNAEFSHIRGGTLDDTSWLEPVAHIWARSRQPGVAVGPDALVFEKQPSGLDAIVALWADRMGSRFIP